MLNPVELWSRADYIPALCARVVSTRLPFHTHTYAARESSWIEDIDPVDGDSSATLPSVASSPEGHDYKAPTRQWKMLVSYM